MTKEKNTSFNPVPWAIALAIALLSFAMVFRLVHSCDPASFDLHGAKIMGAKAAFGGCQELNKLVSPQISSKLNLADNTVTAKKNSSAPPALAKLPAPPTVKPKETKQDTGKRNSTDEFIKNHGLLTIGNSVTDWLKSGKLKGKEVENKIIYSQQSDVKKPFLSAEYLADEKGVTKSLVIPYA
jgi:hypothetical protein